MGNIKNSIGKMLRRDRTTVTEVGRRLRPEAQQAGRIYISGTGRAGTSFLMQLLTALGCDTGFNETEFDGDQSTTVYFKSARAGFEWDIFDKSGPQIIKSPYLCESVDSVIASGISISRVVIPVRDFVSAAKSRELVQYETTGKTDGDAVAGGLWGTETASNQETVLRAKFANLVEACVRNDIPMTFLSFPRFATDPEYAFERLNFLFPNINYTEFSRRFRAVAKAELIHDFK